MKIYINNFNLDILNDIANLFKENLFDTKTYIQLYTNENIYTIDNKNIYVLDIIDKDIKQYENFYKNFTLIIDPSYYNKQQVNSIHGETHLSFETKKNYYKLNNNSNINLVIKFNIVNSNLLPVDIYFKIDKEIDINDIFIKKELIEFLSVLN
jgi:hypothetical protein